jgi:3'-5' exoribonuclease
MVVSRHADEMERDLRELIATVQHPHLRGLLDALLGPDAPTWPQYRDAPAAKRLHQAYRHGLLEHSLGVAQAVSAISATFGGIDRDVAVTGALLHDIGKLDAYTAAGPEIEMTDLGKLQGEIALGYYRVRRAIEDVPDFPEALAVAVLHIILAHHGQLEHGSPVRPCTREATLVHMMDNLGGRLGSFDRLEKELAAGGEMNPSRSAIAMACTRVLASSLFIALRMCVLTVSGESTSRSATSSPVSPWASSSMISRSRLDSEGTRWVLRPDSSAGRSLGST